VELCNVWELQLAMIEGVSVPTEGMWSLADERPVLVGYSQGAAAEPPLTRDELARFSQELGNRRERWRVANELHLLDLYRAHKGGWK